MACYTVMKGCLFSLQLLKSDLNAFQVMQPGAFFENLEGH